MLRLTLRTLLAYLDDVLQPAEAKALGAKIAELKVASDLMDRIKSVMRRRRLVAPPIGPDANMVSDYLDNTLSPQAVNEVEATCLESDVHLAEVAACHQIMTQVHAEPTQATDEIRERLYTLIPGVPSPVDSATPASPSPVGSGASHPVASRPNSPNNDTPPQKPAHAASAASPPPVSHLPQQLKPTPAWKRALVPAGVVAVVLGWLLLIVYDPSFNGSQTKSPEIAQNDGPTNGSDETPTPKSEGENAAIVESETKAITDSETDDSATASVATNDDIPLNPDPPDDSETVAKIDVPTPAAGASTPMDVPQPAPTENGNTASAAMKPPATAAETMPEAKPPELKTPEIVYDSVKGVMLAFNPQENDWSTIARDSQLKTGQQFITPVPFVSSIRVANGRYRIELEGGTLAQFLPPTEDAALGMRLRRGVVSLERPAESADPQTFAVHVRNSVLIVQLLDPGSRCLFHMVPREPSAPNQVLDGDDWEGLFRAQSGRVALNSIGLRGVELEAGQDLEVNPLLTPMPMATDETDEEAVAKTVAVTFRPLDRIPPRLSVDRPRQTTTLERLAGNYEQEFAVGQPMKVKLSQLVQQAPEQTVFQVAEWGVRCLDSMEAMPEMVAILAKTNLPAEARQAAETGLRNWLALNSNQGELMLTEMKNYFFDETPDTIYRLLWGYRPGDATDAAVGKQLVNWLDHDNLVVRELAFHWAKTLSGGRDYGYRPYVESKQDRSSAIERWENHINNTGALAK